MTIQDKEHLDQYEIQLEQKLKELKKCQEIKKLSSCFPCKEFFKCTLRKEYVSVVYSSMNKGQSGGFEF